MKLKAWTLSIGRLGVLTVFTAAQCGPALAADNPDDAKVIQQFKAHAKKSLDLMREEGPRVVSVTPKEITISNVRRPLCGGMTHPNFVDASAFQNYVEALKAINDAHAANKPISIRMESSANALCRTPVIPPKPPASSAQSPVAPPSGPSK